jgi:hypothetical protein
VVFPAAPLRLSRLVDTERAYCRLRIAVRLVFAAARRASFRRRRARHAGRRHPDRPVPAASVARPAGGPAAAAAGRSLPGLRAAPGAAHRAHGGRAGLDRVLGHAAASAAPDGPDP